MIARDSILLGVVILAMGCSSSGSVVSADVTPVDAVAAEQRGETRMEEVSEQPDLYGSPEDVLDLVFDTGPDTSGPLCQPGEGCLLDPCQENEDCLSGWCVGHMGESVCTLQCASECPPGWSCQQIPGTAPDVVFVCISDHANLCLPCATGKDCSGAAGEAAVCVSYGEEGSFCGGICAADGDCPWGFSCQEASSVDGVATKQCVADAGICPCTSKSVALALWSPCVVTNEAGSCNGKRICTEAGLQDCDADLPVAEFCDGMDNDCDGESDEPILVDGGYVHVCDDGNLCTTDTCLGEAGCQNTPLEQGECGDEDACTIGDHCQAGVCVGTPIDCDDENPCTDDTCDGLGGCAFAPNTMVCDDGNPCTVADQCHETQCSGVAVACDCQIDADCAVLEDGNLCNGTLTCDTSALPYKCQVAPETVVECPAPPPSADAFCLAASCDPVSGACSMVAAHEGLACSDGNACTIGDTCIAGVCAAGAAALCADNNPCTDDSCDSAQGCQYQDNVVACNDGDACTTGDACAAGECVGGPVLLCDDGNVCTDNSCDSQAGCVFVSNEAACDDGNACTVGDLCAQSKCGFSGFLDCDDENPCTKDSCSPGVGCNHAPAPGVCDDGNPCTVGDLCLEGVCAPGALNDCDDQNPCTDDSCDDAGLCQHVANQAACSDGNACTMGDHCDAGACVHGGLAQCDDDNLCTNDSCDPATGCIHSLNSAPCDDGSVCTTGDHCHLGECISSGALTCDDANPCTDDACDAQSGCTFVPNAADCDDDNVCTVLDHCNAGFCAGGGLLECDDGNGCTKDFCELQLGCVAVNTQGPCDDGDACTVDSVCLDGACTGGIAFTCDDANPCTDDGCDSQIGCVFTDNEAACEDGNACTTGDLCQNGDCIAGPETDCDDANLCTEDSCQPLTGCAHDAVADETNCGVDLHCVAGVCVADCGTGSQTFSFTGSAQLFTVPDCVESVAIEVWGAEGGPSENKVGGQGGYAKGTLTNAGGTNLYVYVGGKGGTSPNGTGGWNGGGNGTDTETQRGGGGGGASDVRLVGGSWNSAAGLDSRLIVAGGGGGGWNHPCCHPGVGGHGGGTTGGVAPQGGGAGPGTQSSSGCCGGAGFGVGGSNHTYGGGGGGWYGGGSADGCCAGAGAGGSGYVGGVSAGTTSLGGHTGNGKVVITW